MLAELVHVLYNIVDRMYIGHMGEGGTLALTGLGVCFPLITLIGAFANLCSTGGATLATIARGEGDDHKAERIMSTAFTVLLGIGVMWTVSVGLSYLFGIGFGWGLIGMWVAFVLDENIRAGVFIKRWWGLKWTTKSFVKDVK